jgi:hypothetical protein
MPGTCKDEGNYFATGQQGVVELLIQRSRVKLYSSIMLPLTLKILYRGPEKYLGMTRLLAS